MSAGDGKSEGFGERTVANAGRDPIPCALADGARPDELDVGFKERLLVPPSFALTLGTAFDVTTAAVCEVVAEWDCCVVTWSRLRPAAGGRRLDQPVGLPERNSAARKLSGQRDADRVRPRLSPRRSEGSAPATAGGC
ncbi:hypothetical protein [Amycolatopsis benzoatilytica]|uniref:hypothetical protein n=1 Tax=Amycolatopsis benzoatilytica TaxID=346045 RepID=UPI00035C426C|nr:hypothetical protein [Amycolatopsis benzoatilytica]